MKILKGVRQLHKYLIKVYDGFNNLTNEKRIYENIQWAWDEDEAIEKIRFKIETSSSIYHYAGPLIFKADLHDGK